MKGSTQMLPFIIHSVLPFFLCFVIWIINYFATLEKWDWLK